MPSEIRRRDIENLPASTYYQVQFPGHGQVTVAEADANNVMHAPGITTATAYVARRRLRLPSGDPLMTPPGVAAGPAVDDVDLGAGRTRPGQIRARTV